MPNLYDVLKDIDEGRLPSLAEVWGVDFDSRDPQERIHELAEAMLAPAQAEKLFDRLTEEERGALIALAQSDKPMSSMMFTSLYGQIRQMGKGAIQREKPYLKGESVAETLFYRGFVYLRDQQRKDGQIESVYFIPPDLKAVFPLHKTQYDDLEPLPNSSQGRDLLKMSQMDSEIDPEAIQPADTSLVDDMATLLAFIRNHNPVAEKNNLEADMQLLCIPFFFVPTAERMAFLMALANICGFLMLEEGQYVIARNAQDWLKSSRAMQLRTLANQWLTATTYAELSHIDPLIVETPDPDVVRPRENLINLMKQHAPLDHWWDINELIVTIYHQNRFFLRPGGDQDGLYIRHVDGQYLKMDAWEQVEGAYIQFVITRILHWLGLVDLEGDVAHFNSYGRAFLNQSNWAETRLPAEPLEIHEDKTIFASRATPALTRYTVARFTRWVRGGDPFIYELDIMSIRQGLAQGITADQMLRFLSQQSPNAPLPEPIIQAIEVAQIQTREQVRLEKELICRTTSSEALDFIYQEPTLRRFVAARLGPMACVVRPEYEKDFMFTLAEFGIEVE